MVLAIMSAIFVSAMIRHYPVAENQDAFHIGMLHGSLAGDETHAVYAPFTKR